MSNANGNTGISRDDVEKALWQFTGWQGDQLAIDGILVVMDAWNATVTEVMVKSPDSFREGYYHALVTMAEAILDTGGRVRLVPPEAEPVLRAGDVDGLAQAILEKLPAAARKAEDERLVTDPELLESLEQMARGDFAPEVIPSREEAAEDTGGLSGMTGAELDEFMAGCARKPAGNKAEYELDAKEPMDDPGAGVIHGLTDDEVCKFMAALREQPAEDDDEYTGDITCTRCGESKSFTEYFRDSKGRHGRKSRCKQCERERKSA